ncbi:MULTISPECIES: helix-turn-helix domain-containing protein [Desulfovibrio]|nr:helix-turn-helix transcriptional regulator [Desulfovibrio piger]
MKNARIRLGQEILRRRKAMGMTQEELASRMGVSRQSVAKWETGLSSPDIDRLALLRDVLQTSLDELIAPAGRELIPEPVPPAEDSVRPEPAGPVRNLRLLPLILGTLLFCCGLGGLAALWVLSRLHPVRLVDWDGSLHTGLEGYLMATGLWPVLLLACILLGCGSLTLLYLWGTRRKNS